MANALERWFSRLSKDNDQIDADLLTSSADAVGAQHCNSCVQGQMVTVQGRLRTVDLKPAESLATLVAELYDGTDSVDLVWLGRRSIPGIEPGRTIKVRGRIGHHNGNKCIFNPDYELRPVHA